MKRYQLIMALFASFLLWAEGVQARITMPSFFSDRMVLQQKSAVAIWGSSDRKQRKVTVKTSWNAKKYTLCIGNNYVKFTLILHIANNQL